MKQAKQRWSKKYHTGYILRVQANKGPWAGISPSTGGATLSSRQHLVSGHWLFMCLPGSGADICQEGTQPAPPPNTHRTTPHTTHSMHTHNTIHHVPHAHLEAGGLVQRPNLETGCWAQTGMHSHMLFSSWWGKKKVMTISCLRKS